MKRSAIPMVVGVLMIVFGGIGLVVSLVTLKAVPSHHMLEKFPAVVLGIFEVIVAMLQLDAGIACVRYRPSATTRAVAFGFARITLTVGTVLATWLAFRPDSGQASSLPAWFVLGTVVSLAWPAIVIALMTRPSVKGTR
ncbi:MAG TPA: hypothetical protein VGF94_17570 [Kofleriaceae bacterium]|jgi:hypothetical protein